MITIHITDREDKTHSIVAPVDIDLNLMELAKANGLPVDGTCGGMALCASCHMYIISEHEIKEPTYDEITMLDQAFYVEANSRLGCQIKLNEKLDGLTVKLAPVAL